MKSVRGLWLYTICVAVFSVSSAFGQCVNNVDCDDGDACTFDRCVDTVCSNAPAAYGDVVGSESCGPDGVVNLLDILAVFDGFLGVFGDSVPGCSEYNVDLSGPGGCGADGLVDLYDMLAVRDGFIGIDNCCSSCVDAGQCDDGRFCNGVETCDTTCQPGWADNPCAGQQCDEASDTCFNSSARMTCGISPQRVRPGGTVTVDLFLQDVSDLAGFQAGIAVTRLSGSGEAACVGQCASVDLLRSDYVFAEQIAVGLPDHDGLRVAGVSLDNPNTVDVGATPKYMGSFELTISEDAVVGSTFEVSIRTDQLLLSSDRNPISYTAGSACVVTVSPLDCNENGVADLCDIDCGPSGGDCDVPGCGQSADCNANHNPDECDISQGISEDCFVDPACGECLPNGVPGECESRLRMFFVPAGDDPTRYAEGPTVINAFGRQGEMIPLELFVQDSPIPVRGVASAFPCSTPGTEGGSVDYIDGSGTIDVAREDFLLFGTTGTITAINDACDSQDADVRAAVLRNAGSTSVCEPKYFFGFELGISADAAGVFTVDFVGAKDDFSVVISEDSTPVPGLALESLIIDMTPPDCDGNGIPDHCDLDCGPDGGECDVVGCGGSTDCNGNRVPDRCDIADGTSEDCTSNGVPDECDPDCDADGVADSCTLLECGGAPGCSDCNDNGIPDSCDIAQGTSRDDNLNEVPDECDPPAGDEPRLFLVPQGGRPEDFASRPATAVSMRPGESRTLQVWVQKSGRPLGAYQVALDDGVGGESGEVSFVDPMIDEFNPDWVHTGLSGVIQGTNIGPPALMTSVSRSGAPVVTDPRYCGELTYTASLNACGTFAVDFVNPGTVEGESQTLLLDTGNNAFDFTAAGARIGVSEKVYGDVNGDGVTDVFDILCVLDGFEGSFNSCSLSNLDLVPCDGDGVISLEDILGVLNGFTGTPSPCPIICP